MHTFVITPVILRMFTLCNFADFSNLAWSKFQKQYGVISICNKVEPISRERHGILFKNTAGAASFEILITTNFSLKYAQHNIFQTDSIASTTPLRL